MIGPSLLFLEKAQESLAGAESEFVNKRFNNSASRSYYACFQAAISALLEAGINASREQAEWSHAFVQAQFVTELINRRKVLPASLQAVLSQTLRLRLAADYKADPVSETQAARALGNTRRLVEAIRKGGENP